MMDHQHHEQRRAAAEAFEQSLNQLEQRLMDADDDESAASAISASSHSRALSADSLPHPKEDDFASAFNAIAFEAAAADIEQFMDESHDHLSEHEARAYRRPPTVPESDEYTSDET